jgi:RNA methyltransferase, TrmH family
MSQFDSFKSKSRRPGGTSDASRRPGGTSDASRRPGGTSDTSRRPGGTSDNFKPIRRSDSDQSQSPRVISRADMDQARSNPWASLNPKPKLDANQRRRAASDSFGERADRPERAERPYRPDRPDRPRERPPERTERGPDRNRPIRPYGRVESEERTRLTPDLPVEAADRQKELRIYGKHAVVGLHQYRPEAIRKVYYHRSAQNALRELLSWCAAQRIGYREVELDDLSRLAATEHHEGVVADIERGPRLALEELLSSIGNLPVATLILLDGVSNPHNFGAILRNAAHFDATAVLLAPKTSTELSGAAHRVAEGGAEAQPLVYLQSLKELELLKAAGFVLVAAHTRQAKSLWGQKLPKKAVLVFGAEGAGVSDAMLEHCELRVSIPGSGKVDSLNVAQSVAVLLAELSRQRS